MDLIKGKPERLRILNELTPWHAMPADQPAEAIMSKKIYKLCLIRGYTEAYYQLSEEEKKSLWDRVSKAIEKAGAKMATPYYSCRWSNDAYHTFFTMEYPDIESAMMDTTGVEAAGLFRYLVSETILGVEQDVEAATS
jgi:hypothetical protein